MQSHRISDIATALSGEPVGDVDLTVLRAAEPAAAGADDLAIAMHPKFSADLAQGRARAAVLWHDADWQALGLEAAILVARPRLAMAALTTTFKPAKPANGGIHTSAVIDPSARIGGGATIEPYVVIGANVRISKDAHIGAHCSIGSDCEIGERAVLCAGVRVGTGVTIGADFFAHSGVVIGADGFSFVTAEKSSLEDVRQSLGDVDAKPTTQPWLKIHSLGGVVIGNDVEIGANSSVDAGTIRATRVGDGTKIDALVQVGHNVVVGRNCLLCAHVAVGGSAVLGDQVVLGGQAGVADNISIGDGVIAGGASKILSNVPAGRAVLGYPAVKMSNHIETYKLLRRLPRILRDLSANSSDKPDPNSGEL